MSPARRRRLVALGLGEVAEEVEQVLAEEQGVRGTRISSMGLALEALLEAIEQVEFLIKRGR